jgi:hypothetical protein
MIDYMVSDQRHLPDPEKCRTRPVVNAVTFSECLAKDPVSCKYAISFNLAFFCRHPDRRSFKTAGNP